MAGYREAFPRYYDLLTADVDYPRRAAFLLEQVVRRRGSPKLVLDLACGTGSLAFALARLGPEVIGVDASQEMLAQAVLKSAGGPPPVLFLCQRMEELDLYGTVEAAFCTLDSLNHLPDPASLGRVLARMKLFVEPGGLFLFDLNTPYKHRSVLGDNTFVYETPEVFCVWRNSLGPGDSVDINLDFFVPRDRSGHYTRGQESFREVLFPREVLLSLLAQNGFTLLAELGDYEDRPPVETEERILYITQRE